MLSDVIIEMSLKYSSSGIIFKNFFELSSMSWNIGFSRNLVFKLQNKLGFFHIVLQEKSQKFSLTVLESQKLPKLHDLDTESQISQFEWTLHKFF